MSHSNSMISSNDHGTKTMIDKMPPNSAQRNVSTSNEVAGMIRINKKGKGEFVAFNGNKISIGRSSSCDLRLYSASCSSHHAEIELDNGSCVLSDLNSTNGSSVNGMDVERHILNDGDKLSFGTERFVFLEKYMRPGGQNASAKADVVTVVVANPGLRRESRPVVQLASNNSKPSRKTFTQKIRLMVQSGPRAGENIDITYPAEGLSIGRPGHQLLNLTLEGGAYVASADSNTAGNAISKIFLNDSPLGASSQVVENGDSLVVADIEFMVIFPGR